MEEKLRRLMKQEGINSTRLAEILGIQASGISHIMSGRNKPSFDFLIKLLNRFPQINPDWLFLDKGPMYRDEIKKSNSPSVQTSVPEISGSHPNASVPMQHPDAGLFSEPGRTSASIPTPLAAFLERDDDDIIPSGTSHNQSSLPAKGFSPSSRIERIVVFYKDKTFSEYRPE